MTDTTNPAGRSEDTIGSAPARRLRRWFIQVVGSDAEAQAPAPLVRLLGVLARIIASRPRGA